jgi:GT2 family glycosyltransferase
VASVVLNYGRADLARVALESLLGSRLDRHRILLVDNGSPDSAQARAHAAALGVPLLALEENHGFAGGMNRGLAEAGERWSPEFYFLVNSDARVEPDALAQLVLAARGGAELVGPKILFEGGPPARLWAAGGEYQRFRARNRGEGEEDRGQFDRLEEVGFLSGCALLIRRDAFLRVGGFDPRFFLYQEDADLCLRARALGMRLLYQPLARVHHHGSASGGGQYSTFQSFYRWRNRLLLVGKNSHGFARLWFFAAFFPAFAGRDVGLYARQGNWDGLRAMLEGLGDFMGGARNPRRPAASG